MLSVYDELAVDDLPNEQKFVSTSGEVKTHKVAKNVLEKELQKRFGKKLHPVKDSLEHRVQCRHEAVELERHLRKI